MYRALGIILLVAGLDVACIGSPGPDPLLRVTVEADPEYTLSNGTPRPRIILENSRLYLVVGTKEGGRCGIESGILSFVQKSTGTDQVATRGVLDANYMRGPIISAEVTDNGPAFTRVVMVTEDLPDIKEGEETDNRARVAYTLFANSPVLKIEYLDRLEDPDPIVDLGAPGGVERIGGSFSEDAATRIYGQEHYHGGVLHCHPTTYWTSVKDDPHLAWTFGPVDGGPLAYNGHLIVAVASLATGEGYGRVVPVHRDGVRGGARHLKLLWNTGIEFYTRPWTDDDHGRSTENQTFSPPFTAFLFAFEGGLTKAMELGQSIADGDMLTAP